MRTIGIILVFIMLFPAINAQISVVDLDPTDDIPSTDSSNNQTVLTNQQILSRLNQIDTKLANVATRTNLEETTAFTITNLRDEFQSKTDFLLLAIILAILFIVGLAFSIYFILIGKRRVPIAGKQST